jgi:hypothetical protein
LRFRTWGLRFEVQGLGFRVWDSGYKVKGQGFGVSDSGCWDWVRGMRFRITTQGFIVQGLRLRGLGFRVQGSGSRV